MQFIQPRFRDWAESRDQQIFTESGIEIYKDFEIRNPNLRQKWWISREKVNLVTTLIWTFSIFPYISSQFKHYSSHTICVGPLCYEGAVTTSRAQI